MTEVVDMTALLEPGTSELDVPWQSWADASAWEPCLSHEPPDWSEPYVPYPLPEFTYRVVDPFVDGPAYSSDAVPMLPSFPVAGPRLSVSALAGTLESVDPADLPGAHLVNAIMGWEQTIAAAQARQAAFVRELAARSGPDVLRITGDELASALVCTRQAAERLVVRAQSAAEFPSLCDAWSAGLIGTRKVDVILDEVAVADRASADGVVVDAVAAADGMTAPQLARHVRAAVIGADDE
ncbi:hypothetical protein, partial [Cellulomonas sp. P5_C6]